MNFKCFHHEIALGEYVRPEALRRLIRLAAANHYNYYLPYVEHFIRLDSIAKAVPECAYSKDDWRSFEQTGRAVGVEVIPMFNIAGHTAAIGYAYPELCGASGGNEFDITLDTTRKFIDSAIEEFCSISESEYFLIGADEWRTPNHLLKDPKFDLVREYAENVNRVTALLKRRGKRAIMWHDMILHYPQMLDYLTRDVIIAYWRYEKSNGHAALGFFKNAGFITIMATGIRFGLLNTRRAEAFIQAHSETEKYHADGFMTTSWGNTLYEPQLFNIPVSGRILRGEPIPENLLAATGEWEYAASLLSGADAEPHKKAFYQAVGDPAWDEFPEYRDFLIAGVENDKKKLLEIYLRNHYPCGSVFEQLNNPAKTNSKYRLTPEQSMDQDSSGFGITVEKHKFGEKLIVCNEGETFSVYPAFSGTLQDYRLNGNVIIPKFADRFLDQEELVPGRYDGYGVMGLRPAFGLLYVHNPCIVWSGAFKYAIEENADTIGITLTRILPHVRLKYIIRTVRGHSGFTYEVEAENTLSPAPAEWGFNLPLVFADTPKTFKLRPDSEKEIALDEYTGNSLIFTKCRKYLDVRNGPTILRIGVDAEKLSFFQTDWSTRLNYVTPDYISRFVFLETGAKLTDRWSFSAMTVGKEHPAK